jgi:hypothetical protein
MRLELDVIMEGIVRRLGITWNSLPETTNIIHNISIGDICTLNGIIITFHKILPETTNIIQNISIGGICTLNSIIITFHKILQQFG